MRRSGGMLHGRCPTATHPCGTPMKLRPPQQQQPARGRGTAQVTPRKRWGLHRPANEAGPVPQPRRVLR
eukprot:6281193-Alexandrium_andersonii.AAC.1